jgi:hypothetical protein
VGGEFSPRHSSNMLIFHLVDTHGRGRAGSECRVLTSASSGLLPTLAIYGVSSCLKAVASRLLMGRILLPVRQMLITNQFHQPIGRNAATRWSPGENVMRNSRCVTLRRVIRLRSVCLEPRDVVGVVVMYIRLVGEFRQWHRAVIVCLIWHTAH